MLRGLAEQADKFVGMELNDPAIDFVGLARSLGIDGRARQDREGRHRPDRQGAQGRQADADRCRHGARLQADVTRPVSAIAQRVRVADAAAAFARSADYDAVSGISAKILYSATSASPCLPRSDTRPSFCPDRRARQDHDADEARRPVRSLGEHAVRPGLVPGAAGSIRRRAAVGVDADGAFEQTTDAGALMPVQIGAAARRERDAVAAQTAAAPWAMFRARR